MMVRLLSDDGRIRLNDGSPSFDDGYLRSDVHTRLDDGLPSFGYGGPCVGSRLMLCLANRLGKCKFPPLHGQITVLSANGDDLIGVGGKRGKQQGM